MTWSVAMRTLEPGHARDFLSDQGVPFTETSAFGITELVIRCAEADALCLADALQLLGMRQIFDGDGASLLIVRPERNSS